MQDKLQSDLLFTYGYSFEDLSTVMTSYITKGYHAHLICLSIDMYLL